MSNFLVSCDGGSSAIKVVINEEYYFKISNTYALGVPKFSYSGFDKRDSKTLGADLLDVSVELNVNNKTVTRKTDILVGAMADKYKSLAQNRINTEKCSDNYLRISMITSIAHSLLRVMKEQNKELNRRTSLTIDLGTGLPYEEWLDENKRMYFGKMFEGTHLIKFNNPYFLNIFGVEEVELKIDNITVDIEGSGALKVVYNELDIEKDKTSDELVGTCISMLDIGSYTSDEIGALYEDENEYSDNLPVEAILNPTEVISFGHKEGIGTAMEKTIEELKLSSLKGKDINITRRDIEQGRKITREGKSGWIRGTDCYFGDILDRELKDLGVRIATKFANIYEKNGYVVILKYIFITGGGAYYNVVIDTFKSALKERGFSAEIIVCDEKYNIDPVKANALGYYFVIQDAINDDIGEE